MLPSHLLQYVFSVRAGSFWPSSSCSCFCAKICCWILLLSGHIFYFCIVNIANSALSHRQHYYGCHHHHNQREFGVIINDVLNTIASIIIIGERLLSSLFQVTLASPPFYTEDSASTLQVLGDHLLSFKHHRHLLIAYIKFIIYRI